MKVRVLKLVHGDLHKAQRWYERQQRGLAAEVEREFFAALHELEKIGPALSENVLGYRHVWLERFPLTLYFRIHQDVAIVTVMRHGSRDPKSLDTILRRRSEKIL